MNDVQSLMTAAAILAMGGLGLFMYKGDEDVIRDTPVEKQEIQEKTDEVAFEKSEQNFVPFFSRSNEKGDAETDVVDDHLYNELLKMVSGETKIEKRKSRRAYKKTIRQKSRKSK